MSDKARADTQRWPCCECCPGDDPEFHKENGADAHEGPCPSCDEVSSQDAARLRSERDAALSVSRQARAALDELVTHGDLTPSGRRVLNSILGGDS